MHIDRANSRTHTVRHFICDVQLQCLLRCANAGLTLSHLCFRPPPYIALGIMPGLDSELSDVSLQILGVAWAMSAGTDS